MKGNTSTVKRSMASRDHRPDQNDYLFNSEGIKSVTEKTIFKLILGEFDQLQ